MAQALRSAGTRRWHRTTLLALGLLVVAGLLWQRLGPGPLRSRPAAVLGTGSAAVGGLAMERPLAPADGPGGPPTALVPASGLLTAHRPLAARALWQERLRRAQERLTAYRSWARYPPDARPASEQPERLQPAAPLIRVLPLLQKSGASPDVRLQLVQERMTLVGSESTRLSVRCEDAQGALLPCQVLAASAEPRSPAPAGAARLPAVPLRFGDDGRSGDEVAGDGTLSAMLQPARLGFGGYLGALRVALTLRARAAAGRGDDSESGEAIGETAFDLWYTPEPPAVLTGQVREAVSDGSLQLYLGIDVRVAGRYLVTARVDDARGKSFALLERSEELTTGVQEVRLTVFGKLILDAGPAMPLRLRDVDGFLRKSDTDAEPDREYLPLVAGYIHTTESYPLTLFSASDWRSEERDSREKELSAELNAARSALAELDQAAPGAADGPLSPPGSPEPPELPESPASPASGPGTAPETVP